MISPLQCPSNLPLSSHFSGHMLLLFSCSVMSDSATPWTAACQASLSFTISWSLLKLMSIESVMPSNHLIFCHPLLLLPSIFPSIRVFSKKSARVTWTIASKLFSNLFSGNLCPGCSFYNVSFRCLLPRPLIIYLFASQALILNVR